MISSQETVHLLIQEQARSRQLTTAWFVSCCSQTVPKPVTDWGPSGGPSHFRRKLPWAFPARNLAHTVWAHQSDHPLSLFPQLSIFRPSRHSQPAGGPGPGAILHVILSWLENDYPKMGSVDGSGQLCHINCHQ